MAEIALQKLTKRFADGTEAVKKVDLTIHDGELFVLVGPSGCGKSTLLNMIVGLEDISEGELLVEGKVVNDVDPKDRDMAMVFQNYAIYPHMTVRQNMAFPLKLAKLPARQIERRVEEAARLLGLSSHLNRRPGHLSGGQRQRVAMGRAIVREPKAFLMDEPLSNLDAKLRAQMRTEIARLQRRLKITTVYVTHDQTEAMTLGDRVAVMRFGVIQQVGTPQELYHHPANLFVAGFVGSPAMNFFPAEVEGSTLKLPMTELPLPVRVRELLSEEQHTFIAGVRPEHFGEATLVDGTFEHGPTFTATVEIVEWMGAELFAYFHVDDAILSQLDAAGAGPDVSQSMAHMVARLDTTSTVKEDEEVKLWLDARHLHLFDPDTGQNLMRTATAASVSG